MKVYRTAGLTAVWRHMANVDEYALEHVGIPTRLLGYTMGFLDRNSVETIAERTAIIDSIIKKSNPKCVVEIGAGFSSRNKRFRNCSFCELDLPYFKKVKTNIIPFEIGKDQLDLDVKKALFIIEGVSMYLEEGQILSLLKDIRKFKGGVLIDFFSREFSSGKKTIKEKIFKMLFRFFVKRNSPFSFRLKDTEAGVNLLANLGYKKIRHFDYKAKKSIDVLFYAEI